MRENVRAFVELCAQHLPTADPVVEIGAYLVPGQEVIADLRPLFPGTRYVGCDMRPGPGVDRVECADALSFPDDSVGTLLSLDTLEHVAQPQRALDEVWRVLRPGGVAIVSSVMDFPIHDVPSDYWRFTPAGFAELLRRFDAHVYYSGNPWFPSLVLGVAWKRPRGEWPAVFAEEITHRGHLYSRYAPGKPLYAEPTLYPFAWLEDAYRMYHELAAENRALRAALEASGRTLPVREPAYAAKYAGTLADWMLHHQEHIVFTQVRWAGVPIQKNPLDCWIYQEILWEVQPDVIVEIGSYAGGSTLYFCHLCDLVGNGVVVSIDHDRTRFQVRHPRLRELTGESTDPEILRQVGALCHGKRVLVIHDADHTAPAVLRDLQLYAGHVSVGSYLIVEDGVVDVFDPASSLGFREPGPLAAIRQFLAADDRFVVDESRERYDITYNPRGFLKRVR